jgi:curved DNA-binding protein CbpA
MKPDFMTCCEVLELPANPIPSIQEVKKARRILSKKFHPDLHQATPDKAKENEEKTKSINAACDILLELLRHSQPADIISKTKTRPSHQNEESKNSNTSGKKDSDYQTDPEKEAKKRAKRKEKARSKELHRIFSKFERLAKKGVSEAQYHLGTLYRNGQGCIKNKIEALRWFRKAAASGNPKALLFFGFSSAWGVHLPKNSFEAIKLYNEAAGKNLPDAYFQLGLMHYFGFGVKQDFEHAIILYRKAIEFGYKFTDRVAETCGHLKIEIPKEYFRCYRWYSTAAQSKTLD